MQTTRDISTSQRLASARQAAAYLRVLLLAFILTLSSLTSGLQAGQSLLQQDQLHLTHADRSNTGGAQSIRHRQEALRSGAGSGKFADRTHKPLDDGLVPVFIPLRKPGVETAHLGIRPSPVLQAAAHDAYSARAPPLPV